MAFRVTEMTSQLQFDGARPSQFEIIVQNPVTSTGALKLSMTAKAASLPPAQIGTIEVPYFGRKVKIAGDRTYTEWVVTIINDEDFLVKNALEQWNHAINTPEGNLRRFNSASPLQYKSQAQVIQYGKTGIPVREYTMYGLYPSNIEAIDLNWDTTDTIEEFQVTFQYDYWKVTGGITGNGGTEG